MFATPYVGADRVEGKTGHLADLLVTEVEKEKEPDTVGVAGREPANGIQNRASGLPTLEGLIGLRSRVNQACPVNRFRAWCTALPSGSPVVSDSHEPGKKTTGSLKGIQLAERLKENVLGEVFRILPSTKKPVAQCQDLSLVPVNKRRKCVDVACADAADDGFVIASARGFFIACAHSDKT